LSAQFTLGGPRLRAVLFDAGNTLIFLDYARMAAGVGTALGMSLTEDALAVHTAEAARAMERAASDQERATAYLEALFLLAGVPAGRLGEVRSCLARMHGEQHLWSSVPESTPTALARLKAAGLLLGVVSNSEGRVEQALEAAGLREYFDVVVDSGVLGIEKPDPQIFQAALTALGVAAEEALYVGDLYEVDIVGARSAGMEAVLLGTSGGSVPHCQTIGSIAELAHRLLSGDRSMTTPSPLENT
jgi:putative hydrolase of the HAD superfamily